MVRTPAKGEAALVSGGLRFSTVPLCLLLCVLDLERGEDLSQIFRSNVTAGHQADAQMSVAAARPHTRGPVQRAPRVINIIGVESCEVRSELQRQEEQLGCSRHISPSWIADMAKVRPAALWAARRARLFLGVGL